MEFQLSAISFDRAGVAIGLAGSFGAARLMESLLFGVSATDTVTFALVPVLLTAVAVVACLLPARNKSGPDHGSQRRMNSRHPLFVI